MRLMDTAAARLGDPRQALAALAPQLSPPSGGDWRLTAVTPHHSRRRISRRLIAEGGPWLEMVWRAHWQRSPDEQLTQWWQGRMDARAGGVPGVLRVSRIDTEPRWQTFLAEGGQIVRVEPGEHCTAHFPATAGRPDHFGKCYADERVDHARATLASLYQASESRADAFFVGKSLPSAPDCLRQLTVPGEALATRWESTDGESAVLVAALVDLARHGPRLGYALTRDTVLADAAKWCKKLRLAEPSLSDALDAVMRYLECPPNTQAAMVPTHGDCHLDQMLWHQGRIALFDYDNLCQAEAGRDLADLVSQLLCRFDGHDWRPRAGALMNAWRQLSGDLHVPAVFDWHLRSLLLRKAYSQFVRSQAGWQGRCRDALALAADPTLTTALLDEVCA